MNDRDTDDDDCENQFDMYCPKCGASDELDIAATVWVRLCKDGTDADESHDGSHEWDDDSECRCNNCGWTGTVLNASKEKKAEAEEGEYTNFYLHCGRHWRDKWSCMCNDHCPVCDKEIEPYKSVDAEGEVINHVGDELPAFEQGEDDE
jgi:hypothetical protein